MYRMLDGNKPEHVEKKASGKSKIHKLQISPLNKWYPIKFLKISSLYFIYFYCDPA